MKRILLAGADPNNSRDGMICEGVKRILLTKYQDATFDYVFINDQENMGHKDFFPAEEYDLAVYCGTPFISDHIYNSPKWKNVKQLREVHKTVPFIFMGIGTSMNLDKIGTGFLMDQRHRKKFQEFFGSAHAVIVREHLAKEILDNAGVECTQLPCPAYYLNIAQNVNKEGPALVFYDPRIGISQDDWKGPQHEEKWIRYASEFRDFYNNTHADVYVASVEDIPGCKEIGLPEPKVLKTPQDTIEMIKRATWLMSGRVHNAVPAYVNDVNTILLAIDSRAYVFSDYGGTVLFPGGGPVGTRQQVPVSWKASGLETYLKLLP